VATVEPYETIVLETIRELGLERQVIFNKGAVMVLPAGVNKASGLARALAELALSPRNLVACGDGENDHALLDSAEYSVATANAIATLRERADRVTRKTHGDGVLEVIADLIESDLARAPPERPRRTLLLGRTLDGAQVSVATAGTAMIVAGPADGGRTALVAALLERLCAAGYQYCLFDTRGAYPRLARAVVFGSAERAPDGAEVLAALDKPDLQAVVSLAGVGRAERAGFVAGLGRKLAALREGTGRPHWIAFDDAHEAFPTRVGRGADGATAQNAIYATAEPACMREDVIAAATAIVSCGPRAREQLEALTTSILVPPPRDVPASVCDGEALVWLRASTPTPVRIALARDETARGAQRQGVGRHLRRV
jgi:hypothetical protein